MSHRPALDGVRALAVMAVLLNHGSVGWMRAGYLGVDIFFVLSGYLITSLLLAEWSQWRSIDVLEFWRRRARRLLPALFLVVFAVIAYSAVWADGDRRPSIRWDAISTLLYTANWRFALSGQSYFDQFTEPSPLRHMWSLGIEEQFYFIFPFVLLGLLALTRGRRVWLAATLGGLAVGSALLMGALYSPLTDPSRLYYGTDTRAQDLLIGAVLATLTQALWTSPAARLSHPVARSVSIGGLVALAAILVILTGAFWPTSLLYRGGYLVFSILVALVLAAAAYTPESAVARLFALRPLVLVGLISYGVYLWHWPVFVVLNPERTDLHGLPLLAARLAVTAILATASYRFVERPIRQGALKRLQWHGWRVGLAVGVPVVIVASTVFLGPLSAQATDRPDLSVDSPSSAATRVLVIGDSVAESLAVNASGNVPKGVDVRASTEAGCGLGSQELVVGSAVGPANPVCPSTVAQWTSAAETFQPSNVVLSTSAWDVLDHIIDGHTLRVGTPEYAAHLRSELDRVWTAVSVPGATLTILGAPCFAQTPENTLFLDFSADRNDPARADAVNAVYADFAAAHPGRVEVAVLGRLLCPSGTYQRTVQGMVPRDDGVHFTKAGAALVWDWLQAGPMPLRVAPAASPSSSAGP